MDKHPASVEVCVVGHDDSLRHAIRARSHVQVLKALRGLGPCPKIKGGKVRARLTTDIRC